MAVSFVARKCTQCAGKLQYIKEKKIWRCLYCGAEIERQEQYDGLFTIKNVVRQSLLDTAYRRLDSAGKNLIECEKIDSRYVGTLIAKLSYDMIRVITPGACDPRDAKSIFTQLKKSYEQLKAIGTTVTDDEEALYEFLEESDIFATLVLVYDSLGDTARRDTVAQMLDAREVFSKPANGSLLSYAIKNGKLELADQILSNVDNIDPKAALNEVLSKYPDGAAKGERIAALLSAGAVKYEDRSLVETYLGESSNSVQTKSRAAIAALGQEIPISSDLLMDQIVRKADPDTVKEMLSAFCKNKLGDEDVVKILAFAYDCGDSDTALNALRCLKESGQYVFVPARLLITMLSNRKISTDGKIALLRQSFEFKLEQKSFESVLTNYLCSNADAPEDRKDIIDCLFAHAANFPTAMVESYVLKCSADGPNKPLIVSAMFDKGLNVSFFHDLLSKYMNGCTDSEAVRAAVIEVLSENGLKLDPGYFTEYICASADAPPVKIRFIKKMIANGSQLRADAASAYLERTARNQFSSELFSLIFSPGSAFSARAAENYLLWFKDRDAVRAENAKTILDRASADLFSAKCQIEHLGSRIQCNILQAYVLATNDPEAAAMEIVDFLINTKRMKINAEMSVSGSGMKLKKYAVSNRERLSEVANSICEKYKVYSMIF